MLQTAAIVASISGNPWAMLAINAMATGIHVADGSIKSMNHAGVQMGVGAVSTAANMGLGPMGGIAVGMVTSGIEYEEDGSVGWSQNQFKHGVKSGGVKLAVMAAVGNSVAAGFIGSAVDTDGGWNNFGFDEDNWGEHIVNGVAEGLGEGGTGGILLGDLLKTLSYNISENMLDGAGFSDDFGKYNNSINWGDFDPTAEKLGGSIVQGIAALFNDGKEGEKEKNGTSRSRMPEMPDDPFGSFENFVSAAWYGMRQVGSFFDDIGNALKDIGESFTNFLSSGEFATNQEMAEYKAACERIQEAIGNGSASAEDSALEEGSVEYYDLKYAMDPDSMTQEDWDNWKLAMQTEGRDGFYNGDGYSFQMTGGTTAHLSWYEQEMSVGDQESWESLFSSSGMYEGANSEAVKKIMDKHARGEDITSKDFTALMKTMMQYQKDSLPKEIYESIMNDKDAFEKLFGRKFNLDGGITLEKGDPASIMKYAVEISKVYCKMISLYGMMVANGVQGTPDSFGEFTKDLIDKDLINLNKPARVLDAQKIVDSFGGAGNYQIEYHTLNQYNGDGQALLNSLINTAANNPGIQFFNVGINSPHGMNLYNNNGDLRIHDTSWRKFDVSIDGKIDRNNIVNWYYIKKLRRRGR